MRRNLTAGLARLLLRLTLVLTGVIGVAMVTAAGAAAYSVVDSSFAITDFATGLPSSGGVGPAGQAFGPGHALYVAEPSDGHIYRFPPTGGAAGPSTVLGSASFDHPTDIASLGGRMFLSEQGSRNDVVEIDPATGKVLRAIATGLNRPAGLAFDPLSLDLFVTESGAGRVDRISDLSGIHPSTAATLFGSGLGSPDGLAFGSDGTLYVADESASSNIYRLIGTNSPLAGSPTTLGSTGLNTGPAGILVGPGYLLVNRNDGAVTKVELDGFSYPRSAVMSGGTRGDIATAGPDGCGYASQSDRIVRITNANGTCSFAPATPTILTVSIRGTGIGTVTGQPAGFQCTQGRTCVQSFAPGTTVSLTAQPAKDYNGNPIGGTFAGWSGACSGTGACSVTMGSDQYVIATFNAPAVRRPPPPTCKASAVSLRRRVRRRPWPTGRIRYTVRCSQGVTVRVDGTASVPGRRRPLKFGPAGFNLPADTTGRQVIHLPGRIARPAQRRRRVSVVLKVVATAFFSHERWVTTLRIRRL